MSWTIIFTENGAFKATSLILSFDTHTAWDEAKEKHPTMVGMLRGSHASVWFSHLED